MGRMIMMLARIAGRRLALVARLDEASVTESAHAEIIRGLRESLEN